MIVLSIPNDKHIKQRDHCTLPANKKILTEEALLEDALSSSCDDLGDSVPPVDFSPFRLCWISWRFASQHARA
jgi:hypothetical protein